MLRAFRFLTWLSYVVLLGNLVFLGIHMDVMATEKPGFGLVKSVKEMVAAATKPVSQPEHPAESHNDRNGLHHCSVCQVFFPFQPFTIENHESEPGKYRGVAVRIPSTPFLDSLIRPPIKALLI